MKERLIVALDYQDPAEALKLVEELDESIEFYKVGLAMLARGGLEFSVKLKTVYSKRVFLDLKLFDISNTVKKAVTNLVSFGLDFLTVHGDPHIVEAAIKGRKESKTKILAVTILTSMDRNDLDNSLYRTGKIEDIVRQRADNAFSAGADGVIASPHEVALIRSMKSSHKKLIVTPGIRTSGISNDDQKRFSTPSEAFQLGADYIVVGRSITASEDPKGAAKRILRSIAN